MYIMGNILRSDSYSIKVYLLDSSYEYLKVRIFSEYCKSYKFNSTEDTMVKNYSKYIFICGFCVESQGLFIWI